MADYRKLPDHITGLDEQAVLASRQQYGKNDYAVRQKNRLVALLSELLSEPMLILLVAVTIIYFILGETSEAYFMLAAIIVVSGISIYQEGRSNKALAALKKINQPLTLAVRNKKIIGIPTAEIVVGDIMVVEEGNTINADGTVIHANDFSVNESALTGEAYTVFKTTDGDKAVYSGTLVASGLAFVQVEKVGAQTKIGQLGNAILTMKDEPTLLQQQITRFVKGMAIIGLAVFLAVWGYNFYISGSLIGSLLKGLTLAMSILPEEIPVAFTTFMALGARRLMQLGIIVKKVRTVEALGSATVICTDKTGTITENSMQLHNVYDLATDQVYTPDTWNTAAAREIITWSMWASEPVPFDPMEKTLHAVYGKVTDKDIRSNFHFVYEYPLGGTPPMMTHVLEDDNGKRVIAAKGAPEAILAVSDLNEADRKKIRTQLETFANEGYRVLGVASADFSGNDFPAEQQSLPFHFLGLITFYDPPKANIKEVFNKFYDAGIIVKIITGDNSATTKAIAAQAGLKGAGASIDGDVLMQLDEKERQVKMESVNIFTRMFPEAKLAAINALKADNEIVAMTGDGVNDGPALKAAHIGIAMGRKGTEIAKQAAALILSNDDLSGMVDAVAMGRRIYNNIRRAVLYIVAIHIPIILTVSLPLFLGWIYPDIFTPMHVIFLEIVMGPTCSVVYENEPLEKNAMKIPPRPIDETFLSWEEMGRSILQGLVITAGVLGVYQWAAGQGYSEQLTRSMVFTTLIIANVFLTLVNRSNYYSFLTSMKNKNMLMVGVISATLLLTLVMLYVPPVATLFSIQPLTVLQLSICVAVGLISVIWYEAVKAWSRLQQKRD
ncbi:cation-translocating P-type ATPase [Chitinophaga sp. sic0106]|uniref:cation-translocating P-type ATPase n=1 Tax=Chitinophaga sp. sic0106 TaxID=2854785 RepID=UPI001C475196|nr:cation-translocating P-type ATPase [Chitinophaga sp. sic0106]MBV7530323.1 cation-translocating P-type ATPase [Chitinophaga sp. sic0106]